MVKFCKDCQRQLGEYLEGKLEGMTLQRVTDHLEKCPSCRSAYKRLEKLRSLLRSYSHPPLKPDYWTGFWPRLRRRIPTAPKKAAIYSFPRSLIRPVSIPYAAAAGAVAAVLILFVSLRKDGGDNYVGRFQEFNRLNEGGDYVLASPQADGTHPVGNLNSERSGSKSDNFILARADTGQPVGDEDVKYVLANSSMSGASDRYW